MDKWNCSEVSEKWTSEINFLKVFQILALKCGTGLTFPEKLLYSSFKVDYNYSMISALEMESGNETQNVVVPGSEAAGRMCQNNNESNIQLILHYDLFIWTFELLELRTTSTAGKTMLFYAVSL